MQSNGKGDVELSVTLDTSGLKKETEKIKAEIEKGVASSNTEIKPQTDVKPIQIVIQQAKQASAALQQTVKNASNVANEIGDVNKKIPTEEFAQLSQNAAWLEKELEKANEQLDHMELINLEGSKRYEELANKAYELEQALNRTKDQLQAMVELGEAYQNIDTSQDESQAREAELERLQAILDRNRESASQLAEEMEEVAEESAEVGNSFNYENPLEKTALPEQFTNEAEQAQEAISQTQEQAVNQFEDEYARFIEYIQAAEEKAREMSEVIAGLKDVGTDPEELAKMEQEYDTLINKIALMKQSIKMGSTAWNEMTPKERLTLFVDRLKTSLSELGVELKTKVNDGLRRFSESLGVVTKNIARSGLQGLSKLFRKLVPDLNRTNNGFKLGLKNILGYAIGIRSLFALFSKLRGAITEGVNNLAQWRDGNNKVNENLSVFISSLLQFKNQIGAAFAPIINIVVPILNTFIESLIEAGNYLAQFIAKLTGQSSWIRATKVQKNYADSLKGTAKAAKDASGALAPFDDLQILNKKNTGAGSIDPNDMFEEVSLSEMDDKVKGWIDKLKLSWEMADFTDFGKDIGTWLKNALDNIPWEGIKDKARKIAKSIATLINGFVETEGLGESIGRTIAEAINTAFEFVYSFVTTLHWDSVGKFIGESLLGFVNNIDGKLIGETVGQTLWGAIQLAFHTVKTFAEGGGFKTLGQQISDVINGFFEKMAQTDKQTGKNGWQMLGESLSVSISGIIETLTTALNGLNWEAIGQAIFDLITSIDWDKLLVDLGELAKAVLDGVGKALNQIGKNDPSVLNIAAAIAAAIALASAAGFSLPALTLSTPELILIAAAVKLMADTVEMVEERNDAREYEEVNDLLNRTSDKTYHIVGDAEKIQNVAKHLKLAQEAAANGLIVSDEYIQETIDAYNELIDFYDGIDAGMVHVLKENSNVLYDRLGDINEVMGRHHPELAEVRKEYDALNMSYESASEYLNAYNSSMDKTTQEYEYYTSMTQKVTSATEEVGDVTDNASIVVDDFGVHLEEANNAMRGSTASAKQMFDNLTTTSKTTSNSFTESFDAVVHATDNTNESLGEVSKTVGELGPVVNDAVGEFENLEETVEGSGEQMSSGFLSGLENLKKGWENFWDGVINWFKDLFGIHSPSTLMKEFGVDIVQGLLNGIESLKESVVQLWENIKKSVSDKVYEMRGDVIKWVNNLKDGVINVFTSVKEKALLIWDGIKNGLKAPLNAILSGVETMVNGFIKAINRMIEGINNLGNIKMPKALKDKFGMEDISINIPTLKEISLPRLAQGAVIPPNREFMAVLGDQTSGTNIEAPLETIKEALAEVMGSQSQAVGSAVMQLDGQTFARLVTPYVVSELGRRGYDVKVIGA